MAQQSETSSAALSKHEPARKRTKTSALDRSHLMSTPGFYTRAWRRLRKDKVAMVSLVVAVFILLFSFGAPVVSMLTGYDYATGDLRAKLLA